MTLTGPAPMTADEFEKFVVEHEAPRYELNEGKAVKVAPNSDIQSNLAVKISAHLYFHVERGGQGKVFSEAGFRLTSPPNTVRAPDVSLILSKHFTGLQGRFRDGAPDLAVKIVSSSDNAANLDRKIQEYLANGAQRVWVVYPESRSVVAYWPDGAARRFAGAETLTEPEFLPGFALPLAELFR